MKLTVRYFAALREALGPQEAVEVPVGTSLAALRDDLIATSPTHAVALRRGRALRCAVNHQLADDALLLQDGDEVAFFPPVTGG